MEAILERWASMFRDAHRWPRRARWLINHANLHGRDGIAVKLFWFVHGGRERITHIVAIQAFRVYNMRKPIVLRGL
jgi:hypothetical protein